ncbi:hypothetical protein LTR85_005607 [Meristemomyces frigidus]|nr:hypothetical protein LTR85_005607 [Meristemomyces frigidus]
MPDVLSIDALFQETRLTVIAAERPFTENAWGEHLASLLAKGETEAHRWAELMFEGVKARMDGSSSPTMPPSLPGNAEEAHHPPLQPMPASRNLGSKAQELCFDGPKVGGEGHWNFTATLGQTLKHGEGTDGHIGLWAKIDPNGTVIDVSRILFSAYASSLTQPQRIAVKEVCTDTMPHISWDSSLIWYGDPKDERPGEVMMHEALSGLKPSTHVVRLMGSAVYLDQKMYRIYMEYCPHGDLESVISLYTQRNNMIDKDGQKLNM